MLPSRLHLALIGRSIAHSLSPALHEELARRVGMDISFELIDIEHGELPRTIDRLRVGEINGANVTSPYKDSVIPYVDELSTAAMQAEAVNVLFVRNGRLVGDNTDIAGVRSTIARFIPEIHGTVSILGTGGAARAAAVACLDLPGIREIQFRTRNVHSAKARLASFSGPLCSIVRKDAPLACNLLVNATPSGLGAGGTSPLEDADFSQVDSLFDMNYVPLETRLMRDALRNGVCTIGGLRMFIVQGVEAFGRWTGMLPASDGLEEMLRAIVQHRMEDAA